MPRCSVGGLASAASTAARGPSLYATAAVTPAIREIGVFNTTSTACHVAICRASTTGTQGAGLTEVCEENNAYTPVATGFQTHTADATLGSPVRYGELGAAVGAGIVWTWGANGLVLPAATTAGVVISCPSGTGQVLDFYIVWDE